MFDCHLHLDASLVSIDGLLASMDRFGIEKAALIAPMTADLEKTPMITYGGPVLRRAMTSRFRPIRRALRRLYGSWVGKSGRVDVGGRSYGVIAEPDNEPVLRAVKQHPDRFLGWIFVNPAGPKKPLAEIERRLETPGMIGVKAHPFWHDFSVSALRETAACCEKHGLAMLIHLGTGPNGDFTLLPEKYPDLTIIYAHAGIPYQRAVCEYARSKKNVFVDLSSPGYVDAAITAAAVRRAGVENCLFGSDGPYFHHANGRLDFGVNRRLLETLNLTEADFRRIASENFTAIIGKK